jgi:serine/threonine protein kinase/tetratricopeptide (TPR) repeat protein
MRKGTANIVKCPKCSFENPSDTRFCGNCASSLYPSEELSAPPTETLHVVKKELSTGTSFSRRYEVIEELGKGGMGIVYKVFDKKIKEKVALKLLKPEIASDEKTIERFSDEIRNSRKIVHKNVCRMYDLSEEEGTHFITMEYVRGEDLKSMIRMMGQLSPGQAVFIAKQVSGGLAEAHRLGVIHRDLKPQNIMIDREGNARIMDFGIARSLKEKGITGEGMIIGTPEYMSPEQVEGKNVDHRSDFYSFGIILYEMLTGRVPFEGDTPLSIAVKHKIEPPPDPRKLNAQISEDLSRLILKCMEKDKNKRYQSAEELLSELDRIEKGIPVPEKILPKRKPLTSKEISITFKKRWKVLVPVFAAILLVGIIVLYLFIIKQAPHAGKMRLAVLPFENLGLPEDEYFADGITDEIMARLGSIEKLAVIARTSSIQYKRTNKAIHQIAEELGVDYILSGTVRWQRQPVGPSKVRVTPNLIRASDATQIWANVYEETIDEVFEVQSEIAKRVAEALNIALMEPERKALEAKPTESTEAYEYYLRGNDYFNRGRDNKKDLGISIEMFEKAINLDPNFIQAYVQLSIAHAGAYWYHFDHTEERAAKAKQVIDKAFQLNPDLPEVHLALGVYYYLCKLDYEHALEQFTIAQKKQPKNSETFEYTAYVNRRQGKLNEAVTNLKKALEIDPRSNLIAFNLGGTYALMRDYTEAVFFYNKAISLSPDYVRAYSWKTRLYLNGEGNTKKARAVLEEASRKITLLDEHLIVYPWVLIEIFDGNYKQALDRLSLVSSEAFTDQFYFVPRSQLYAEIYGLMNEKQKEQEYYNLARIYLENKIKEQPDDSRFHSALGIAYAGLRLKEKAIQEAEKAVEILPVSKEAYRGIFRAKDLAQVYVMVGEYDKAVDQIDYLLSIPAEMSVRLFKIDPVFAPLHGLARFQKLIERYK